MMPKGSASIAERPQPSRNPDSEWSDERLCLWAAAGVVSIIIYGSLLPFDLRCSVGLNLAAWLQQVRFVPWPSVSRTDLIVNAAIGVPLGFFLRGALCGVRRPSPLANARAVLVAAGLSALLGTAVEMLQVLSPMRNSSWNDMLSQAFGAVLGAVVWSRIGARVIRWLRHVANERESVALAVCLLQVYLPIYLVVQLTPFDTHRAAELAAMYEAGRALVSAAYSPEPTVGVLNNVVGNVLLNIPIGTLAALGWVRRGRRRAGRWQVLLGISIIAAVEIAHELLWSHHARISDLFAGTLGVMIGIAAARRLALPVAKDSNGQLQLAHRWFRVAAGAWILMLVWYYWQPFEFELTSEVVNRRLTRIAVVPFAFSYWYASYSGESMAGRSRDAGQFPVDRSARIASEAGVAGQFGSERAAISGSGHYRRRDDCATRNRAWADVLADALPRRY